jgi:hypothetical protein
MTIPRVVSVSSPFALYCSITAMVAAGAVVEEIAARTIAISVGILKSLPVK